MIHAAGQRPVVSAVGAAGMVPIRAFPAGPRWIPLSPTARYQSEVRMHARKQKRRTHFGRSLRASGGHRTHFLRGLANRVEDGDTQDATREAIFDNGDESAEEHIGGNEKGSHGAQNPRLVATVVTSVCQT